MNKEYLEGEVKVSIPQTVKPRSKLLLNNKQSKSSEDSSIDSFWLSSEEEDYSKQVLKSVNNPYLTDLPRDEIELETRRPYSETTQFDEKEPFLYQDVLASLEEHDPLKPIEFGKTAMTNFVHFDSGSSNFSLNCFEKGTFIMNSKKRKFNIGANYTISLEEGQFNREKPSFISKLRSNYRKNLFNLFDTGLNPKKAKDENERRRVLCTVAVKLPCNKGFRWFPEF